MANLTMDDVARMQRSARALLHAMAKRKELEEERAELEKRIEEHETTIGGLEQKFNAARGLEVPADDRLPAGNGAPTDDAAPWAQPLFPESKPEAEPEAEPIHRACFSSARPRPFRRRKGTKQTEYWYSSAMYAQQARKLEIGTFATFQDSEDRTRPGVWLTHPEEWKQIRASCQHWGKSTGTRLRTSIGCPANSGEK